MKKSSVGTPSGKNRSIVTASTTALEAGRCEKTAAETFANWHKSLRADDKGTWGKNQPKKAKGIAAPQVTPAMQRAMRKETKENCDANGRPSIATMAAQWEFMRAQFLNNDGEELAWHMESKKGGAYKYAHNKNKKAEDAYFKALYDAEILQTKLSFLKDSGHIPRLLKNMFKPYDTLHHNPYDENQQQIVGINQLMLKEFVLNNKGAFYKDLESVLTRLCELDNFPEVARRSGRVLEVQIPEERRLIEAKIAMTQTISEESLKEMEKWSKREKETADYEKVMQEEDRAWLESNEARNVAALKKMRSLIPVDIASVSVNDLIQRAKENGHLITLELAQELKNNKLLHWVVTHKEDIAMSNFLNGDKRQYFVNLEGLDIVELRAIRLCIPDKFELDNDGAKAEWRERFVTRVKQLAQQENGETVLGPWDGDAGKRSYVQLPPLKPDLVRRPVYFFRTYEQSLAKLKQYDDKAAMLTKKQGWLEKAEKEQLELKAEYDTILVESRDADFKATYGADVIAKAKEVAKKEYQDADKKAKLLKKDVESLKQSIINAPVSREQFVQGMEALDEYLASREVDWKNKTDCVEIVGTYPEEPEIIRAERDAAKCLSVEEEALKRKADLMSLKRAESNGNIAETSEPAVCGDNSKPFSSGDAAGRESDESSSVASGNGSEGASGINSEAPLSASNADGADVRRSSVLDTPSGKRNSVLLNANPDMISKLNNIFGGSAGPLPTPPRAKRHSMMSPAAKAQNSILNGSDENSDPLASQQPPKQVKTNSKTLMVMIFYF